MTTNEHSASGIARPTYLAYHVRDGKGDKGFWTKVGVAFEHRDKKGFSVLLDCVPLDCRISLREASEKKD